MLLETLAGAVVGLVVLWLMFEPLLFPARAHQPELVEPEDPDETPEGRALLALKEIEFDRATGKLSDEDYQMLKARYTERALALLRETPETAAAPAAGPVNADEETDPLESLIAARTVELADGGAGRGAPRCPACGPRPEPDAVYCSECGRAIPVAA